MGATIVVGATGGIGRALAERLAARGQPLVLVARDAGRLADLATTLGATAAVADATDGDAIERVFADAEAAHGRIDGAVNLAGSLLLRPAHLTKTADFEAVIRANLLTAFHVLRSAVARQSRAGGGAVVLVSSAAATLGLANHEAIAAAKAGIVGLARSAAATYAPKGVRVNVVAPGLVDTPLAEPITRAPASLAASVAMHPLGRIGAPADVADAIAYLLDAPFVTGQVLGVDGGLAAAKLPR